MQDTKKIITQLDQLEKSGIGSFHNVISIHGLQKVKETLDLYYLGVKYGFDNQELTDILQPILVISKNNEQKESQSSVESDIPTTKQKNTELPSTTQEEVSVVKSSDFLLAEAFTSWVGDEDLNLSPFEVCQFFNKTPNQRMRNKLCKYFKENKISSFRVKNCLRYSYNTVDRYKIPVDLEVLSDLRGIVEGLDREEPTVVDFISPYDFLDGTHCDFYLLDNQDSRLNIVLNTKLVSEFEENNSRLSHFEKNDEGHYKDNPRNLFLLGRSMEMCFFEKSINSLCKNIVDSVDPTLIKDIVSHVRTELDKIRVRNLWDSKEMSLSKRMQGRVYLLTYMLIVYRSQDLNVFPII